MTQHKQMAGSIRSIVFDQLMITWPENSAKIERWFLQCAEKSDRYWKKCETLTLRTIMNFILLGVAIDEIGS